MGLSKEKRKTIDKYVTEVSERWILYAKLGCAVACASDDIKELAQYVTKKDYDEGAVSEVIEKFVLGEDHE